MRLEELADALRHDLWINQKMIVICPVGTGLKVEALVLRYGMDDLWSVQESARCGDKILLINEPDAGLL
jgi:hypothetical protein